MDEGQATTAEKEGESCCEAVEIDYTTVKSCYDGDRGTDLLQAAADTFNAALPGSVSLQGQAADHHQCVIALPDPLNPPRM